MAGDAIPQRLLSAGEVRDWLVSNHLQRVPVADDQGSSLDLVTLREGGLGGGSITSLHALDLKRVMTLAVSAPITTGVAIAVDQTVSTLALVLGVVSLVSSVHAAVTVELAERHATVLWTLWVSRSGASELVPKQGLLERVNQELTSYKHSPMTQGELDTSLIFLRRYRCIADDGAMIRIRQAVRIVQGSP